MADNKDKKVLNVPHLRFPEFSGEWEKKRFKDVCNITTGNKNTQDKSDDGIYPFYVRSQNVERINSWTFDGEAILTAGDGVGVGKVFHYSTGKIGVHQRVYILSDFKCDGKYLYSYFAGNFYNSVKRMSAKNSVDSVRMEMIADMPISLPSTMEQKKIGHLLALLDERIATQNKIIEDLKKLKSAIIERAYCDRSYHPYRIGDVIEQISERNKDKSIDMVLSVSNKQGFINQSEQFEDRIIASEDTSNYKIVPSAHTVQAYVNALLESYFFYEMQKRLEGSVRQCLSFEGICNIPIYIPSSEEQHTIGKKISVLLGKIDIETHYHFKLVEQKHYLLRQMFI